MALLVIISGILIFTACSSDDGQDIVIVDIPNDFKTEYIQGETYDFDRIKVKVNGEVVTGGYTFDKISERKINDNIRYSEIVYSVKMNGKYIGKKIRITEYERINRLEIYLEPAAKTTFFVDEEIDYSGWYLKLVYYSGYGLLPFTEDMLSNELSTDSEGRKSVSVSYRDVSTSNVASILVQRYTKNDPVIEILETGVNYVKLAGEDGVSYSLDEEKWQTSPQFTGLDAGTQYTVYAKVLEDRKTNPTKTVSETFTTDKYNVPAPNIEVFDITTNSFKVIKQEGVDVWAENAQRTEDNTDGNWLFSGLQAFTDYVVYAVVPSTNTTHESPTTEIVVTTKQIKDSITAEPVQTFDYSKSPITPSFSMESGTSFSSDKFEIIYKKNGREVDRATDAGEYEVEISFKDGRYDVAPKEIKLIINKRPITIQAENRSSVYGSNEQSLRYTVTSENQLAFGDLLSGSIVREPGKDAGEYAITIGTLSHKNYDITFINGIYTIEKKAAIITPNNASKVFGENDKELTYKVYGLLGTDTLTGGLTREPGEDVGEYDIAGAFENSNYDILVENAVFTIIPSSNISFTLKDTTITYDGQSHGIVAETEITADFAYLYNGKKEEPVKAGTYEVEVTATGKGNYTGTKVQKCILTIGKKAVTVTVSDATKIYSESNPSFALTMNGNIAGDIFGTPDFYTSATKYSDVGTYGIMVYGLGNDNYDITTVSGTLTITKKEITITADSKNKVYGDNDPEFTYKASGDIEIPGALTRTAGENVGEYDITIGTLGDKNLDIIFVGGKLTITKAELLIKVNNAEREVGSENPEFNSVMTGLKLNDSVTVNYSCSATEESPIGTYDITATASDDNYEITIVSGTLTVNKLTNFIVIVENVSVTYDGYKHSITATSAATVDFEYFYNGGKDEPVNAGIYEVMIIATGTGDYEGEKTLYRTLTIIPRSIIVTADDATSVYGGEEALLTYTYKDDLLGNAFSGNIAKERGRTAGEYKIGIGTLALENHTITFVEGKYTITKRPITVTADNKARVYGNNNPEFTYSVTDGSLVSGDVLGLCTFSVSATRTSSVGSYEIGISGIANSNYAITYVSGSLSITARNISLNVGENVFTYSGSKVVPEVSLANLANNDIVDILFDKDVVNAGEYTISASISDTNYLLTGITSFDVVINKAQQQVTIDKDVFPYTGSAHSIVATLIKGDGAITYENNAMTNVGDYVVTVNAAETPNFLALSEDFDIKVIKTEVKLEGITISDITYGDKLSVSIVSGIAKLIDIVVTGTFSIVNGDDILHAGSHSVEIVFTPDDSNIDAKSLMAVINVNRKTAEISVEDGGKGIGNADPVIYYTVSGILPDDEYTPVLTRVAGEAVGEYAYTVVDDGSGDYAPVIVSSTKFYILDKLVQFSGYSDEFIYRVGVTNGYAMKLSFKTGYDISSLEVIFITVAGTAGGKFNGELVTFSGSGKLQIGLKIKDTFNVVFDEKIFEVVDKAVNVTLFSHIKSNVDLCLHSDVKLTSSVSINAGYALYGNGYTIDGSEWKPSSDYLSLVEVSGTLDNVKVIGAYAGDGFNSSSNPDDYYKTTQAVRIQGNAKILNSHIEFGRYAVRVGNIGDALIENSTLKNGTQTIFIKPSNGGMNEKLTLRNVNIVQNPGSDKYPGIGIYFESVPCKDFTLRLEGDVNFYCMYTQSDINRMPTSYQAILTTLWNDSSLSYIKHSIDGTTYLNAAIVHLMSDTNQFNLSIDENCNCYNKFSRVEKSVSLLGVSYKGAGYTFDKNKVTTAEMKELLTEPESKAGHSYSPVPVKTAGTYKTEVKSVVETGSYYTLDNAGIRFVKYGEDLNFEISSVQQLTSAFGKYEILENGARFYLGQYLVTYKVTDRFDGIFAYFTTKVIITDNAPSPVIVFTYAKSKGSGTKDDPFLWTGKTVGTLFDPDYDRNLDLFFGVAAFDSNGNSISRENFTITIQETVFSNTSEAVFSYTSNNEETPTYSVSYKVTDVQGKTTTATRYIKMNNYAKRPDNGTAPGVTRSVAGYGELHDINIGEISITGAGTMVACDGKSSYVLTASGATKYVFNETGAVVLP